MASHNSDGDEQRGVVLLRERNVMILNEFPVVIAFVGMRGGSFLIWIGERDGATKRLASLALAVAGDATAIVNHNDLFAQGLARRLSIKFNHNKPVYVSYNCVERNYRNDDFLLDVNLKVNEFVAECAGIEAGSAGENE